MTDDGIEVLTDDGEEAWATLVWKAQQGRCSGCGCSQSEQLKVRMVIPRELGGKEIVSNGILLCRTCELAKKLTNGLSTKYGFRSISSLVRYLMQKYAEDPDWFPDLELYQDTGADTKVNVWVGRELYAAFKSEVDVRGSTVTDVLKSLIQMYEIEHERIVGRTKD